LHSHFKSKSKVYTLYILLLNRTVISASNVILFNRLLHVLFAVTKFNFEWIYFTSVFYVKLFMFGYI
jgi:hypothetical protein